MGTRRPVIVVKHYLHGDLRNALGIAKVLSDRLGGTVEITDAHLRTNLFDGLLRFIIRCRHSRQSGPNPGVGEKLWPLLFRGALPNKINDALVVSTLGRGEPVAAFFSTFWHASAIHLGSPKRMPRSAFAAILSHPGVSPKQGEIELSISPTHARLAHHTVRTGDTKKVAVLIGGDAPQIRYESASWDRLARHLKLISDIPRTEICISTSPRTGRQVEEKILTQLQKYQVRTSRFIEYGRGDRESVESILENTFAVIVTADSVSMISDAVALGLSVFAVHDENIASQRVDNFLQKLSHKKLISIINLRATPPGDPLDTSKIAPFDVCWSDELWKELAERIPLASSSDAVNK